MVQMAGKGDTRTEIKINATGGMQGTVVAGRDARDVTITVGGQPTLAAKEDLQVDDLRQLLAEIQTKLAALAADKEALQAISAAAPFAAQGAEASVNQVAAQVEGEVKEEDAKSLSSNLADASSLLGSILDGAKTVAQKAGEVGQAVKPIAEALEPLVEMLGVAALWVGKLWLAG
jgi:hypothetical protein